MKDYTLIATRPGDLSKIVNKGNCVNLCATVAVSLMVSIPLNNTIQSFYRFRLYIRH
jgi:hypothetical protein